MRYMQGHWQGVNFNLIFISTPRTKGEHTRANVHLLFSHEKACIMPKDSLTAHPESPYSRSIETR